MKIWRMITVLSTAAVLLLAAQKLSGLQTAGGAASGVIAGGPSDIIFIGHDRLGAALATKTEELATSPGLRIYGAHRAGPGGVEAHEKEVDVFYITDGEASIVTGGTLVDPKAAGPGEMRGSDIRGGQVRRVVKGDVLILPAGTPHWFKEVPKSVNYFVVKVIRP